MRKNCAGWLSITNDDRNEEKNITKELFVNWFANSSYFVFPIKIETWSSWILASLGSTSKDSFRSSNSRCCWIDIVRTINRNSLIIFFVYRTPWRDDETTLIDRFDVRSHLDIIDEYALKHQQNQQGSESVLFQIFSNRWQIDSKNNKYLLFIIDHYQKPN